MFPDLTDSTYLRLQQKASQMLGISLQEEKKEIIRNKLAKRLNALKLDSFEAYLHRIENNLEETEVLINLLTVNETSFFREQSHFDYIEKHVVSKTLSTFHCWSAAASNGAEAYSLAMMLDQALGAHCEWQILASDVNSEILHVARRGVYPLSMADKIPSPLRARYCMRGTGENEGLFAVDEKIKKRLIFKSGNLLNLMKLPLQMDVVLLRNVLIYYDLHKRQNIIQNVLHNLKPGGYLIVGHSEHLDCSQFPLTMKAPTIYQRGG